MLKSYFGDNAWDDDTKKKLMEEMDTDGDGTIDSEEFYKWMVLNASNVGTADEKGTKALQRREERLKLADATIDDHMMELLDEVSAIYLWTEACHIFVFHIIVIHLIHHTFATHFSSYTIVSN